MIWEGFDNNEFIKKMPESRIELKWGSVTKTVQRLPIVNIFFSNPWYQNSICLCLRIWGSVQLLSIVQITIPRCKVWSQLFVQIEGLRGRVKFHWGLENHFFFWYFQVCENHAHKRFQKGRGTLVGVDKFKILLKDPRKV